MIDLYVMIRYRNSKKLCMMSRHVIMKQVGRNRWDLIGPKGNRIAEDIYLYSRVEAIEWVKAYISSYAGWTYEIEE